MNGTHLNCTDAGFVNINTQLFVKVEVYNKSPQMPWKVSVKCNFIYFYLFIFMYQVLYNMTSFIPKIES